jgi:hypothetical protein
MRMRAPTQARAQERALVIALLASLLLWSLPFGGFVLYPFKLLTTWVHEMWHGIMMMLTGAGFDRLELYRDTSGLARPLRGVGGAALAAVASAGYMGAGLLGAFLLVVSQRWHRVRTVLVVLAAALGLSLLLWVSNDFGQGVVAIGAIVFCVIARFAPRRVSFFLVNFMAAQICINAVLDIRILFRPVLVMDGKVVTISDALTMAAATFGPPWMWAGFWMIWSFLCFYAALRLTYLRPAGESPAAEPPAAEPAAAGGTAGTARTANPGRPAS